MSESKFTPGPWGIQDDHGKRWIETITGNDDTIAEIHRRRDKGSVYSCDEALANAKLIASAPCLLAALVSARDDLKAILPMCPGDYIEKAIASADAIIRKATA
ncbi:hypothetical protein GHO26_00690 [Pseudomonas helleri]|uniref:hypothetical protein n=1 Tax=Pseudomonas helleri TaxID=1608996 RepID=UPI001294D74E|nr:hypothetical protein [Pseudomonas helleri]MQU56298.1 hypothetical protein [Pseudomonas helleri]